ncbi:hypothetical protein RJ639_044380 [Escallonia herrerae]|uniref:UDP-glycosyltransferase n=1 Tax=Escallonia herrerae TaxID=1293975 RepID=A0AA89B6U4_9ASTE|nr:hypothetical protein RJ639_044380 [Escallonia herrerae]
MLKKLRRILGHRHRLNSRFQKDMRLKDFRGMIRTTIQDNFLPKSYKASANVVQTCDALEPNLVNALSTIRPHLYTIGLVQLLLNQTSLSSEEAHLKFIGYSLWKEEHHNRHDTHQLVEFALGLSISNQTFLWIIRPDLVVGESAILPSEFVEVTKERGFTASWCPQKQVLNHPSIGRFLAHCGWNSTIESFSSGVPMICWSFFYDHPTNCKFICKEWEVGIKIDDVSRRKENEEQGHRLEEKGRRGYCSRWVIVIEFGKIGEKAMVP